MDGKAMIKLACLVFAITPLAMADGPGRIYTKPEAGDAGAISGKVDGAILTHAIAVERDRKRVYQASLADGGKSFRFANLPVGRFDLVLVTKDGRVIEGLGLGAKPELPEASVGHLHDGVAKADSFFNRRVIHRFGVESGVALVFAERIRDGEILRGSGQRVDVCLRRLEIIELRQADDDWQMVGTRHLYREETPPIKGIPFLTHIHLPALGGLRLAGNPKDLVLINLTKQDTK